MKNNSLTELVFILDRSGSMAHLESDTIGGYNSFIEKQKKEQGTATVTTVLFDDKFELIHENADITKVKPLTEKEYYARGMTALFDAIGKTVNLVGNRHKFAPSDQVPGKTMVIIITDGCENSSREYNLSAVKAIIERQKERFGWEFLFLGANMDAISAAGYIGISADRAATYKADGLGTQMNFDAVCTAACDVRAARPIRKDWKSKIEKRNK